MSLDETLVLQRLPYLEVDLAREGVRVGTGDGSVDSGPHTLAVLDAFASPTSVQDAVAALKGRSSGIQDWLDLLGTIDLLHQAGLLVQPGSESARPPTPIDPGVAAFHVDMLDDRERTSAFIRAIEETVSEGDVVVDIGTGTGVLAMAAARAGASRVYAIEAGSVADVAEALIRANGFADRITVVKGWSTQVALPERADVFVSETIGAQPLGERVLELSRDALKRHLAPGARMVPRGLRVLGVVLPRMRLSERGFTAEAVERWREWYGFDFSSLPIPEPGDVLFLNALDEHVRALGALAAPFAFGEIDLTRPGDLVFESTVEVTIEEAGAVDGVAIYFELDVAPGITVTNDPGRAGGTNHWANPVGFLPRPVEVQAGDIVRIAYRYGGMKAELSCEKVG